MHGKPLQRGVIYTVVYAMLYLPQQTRGASCGRCCRLDNIFRNFFSPKFQRGQGGVLNLLYGGYKPTVTVLDLMYGGNRPTADALDLRYCGHKPIATVLDLL